MKRPPAISYPSDVAFTPAVKAIQSRKGSRPAILPTSWLIVIFGERV
jgi:hypothetical protein